MSRGSGALAQGLLARLGFMVEVAANGSAALEMAQKQAYDLIFMDMQMPVMDGVTATRAMRDAGLSLPIVAMTANAMEQDRQRCMDAGMDDFLSKPVEPHEMIRLARRWLTAPRNRGT